MMCVESEYVRKTVSAEIVERHRYNGRIGKS